jgi:hypothetical protein
LKVVCLQKGCRKNAETELQYFYKNQ